MGKDNEDYLDQLLNQVKNQEVPRRQFKLTDEEDEFEKTSASFTYAKKQEEKPIEKTARKSPTDSFLEEFERELEDFNSDDFIKEFETEIEEEMIDYEPDDSVETVKTEAHKLLNINKDRKKDKKKKSEAKEQKPGKEKKSSVKEAPIQKEDSSETLQEESNEDIFANMTAAMGLDMPESSIIANGSIDESEVFSDNDNSSAIEDTLPDEVIEDNEDVINSNPEDNGDFNVADFIAASFDENNSDSEVEPTLSENNEEEVGISDIAEGFDLGKEELFEVDNDSDSGEIESEVGMSEDNAVDEDNSDVSGESSDEDILSMLSSLGGENEDLKDIGDMLSKDEQGETVKEMSEEESLAESLSELGFGSFDDSEDSTPEDSFEETQQAAPAEKKKAKPDSNKKQDNETDSTDKKPKSFMDKIKSLFFGPDEEEVVEEKKGGVKPTTQLEDLDLDDENLELLRTLEGDGQEETEEEHEDTPEEIKAKKKAEKEAEKAAKKAAKEEAAKAKAAKKAAKPPKPPKVKKPAVKDNTPPLPKGPVFVVLLLGVSIYLIVTIVGNGVYKRHSMAEAKDDYAKGKYSKAYGILIQLEIKEEEDELLFEKTKILASMQDLYDTYELMNNIGRSELALDALVRMIGHYDKKIKSAGELGITSELTKFEDKAETLLQSVYNINYDDAVKLYAIRDRQRYSIELVKALKKAGIM